MMRRCSFLLIACLATVPAQAAEHPSPSQEKVSALLEKVKKDAAHMSIPSNTHSAEGLKAAQDIFAHIQDEPFQNRLEERKQSLEKRHLGPGETLVAEKERPTLSPQEKIFLFLSSSVPTATINTYLATLGATGSSEIVPVMFGFAAGLAQAKTQGKFFATILQQDPSCRDQAQNRCPRLTLSIKIDPSLFKRYGISRVPALVYDRGGDVVVIEGDAGLTTLLSRINEEARSQGLTSLLTTIQSTN